MVRLLKILVCLSISFTLWGCESLFFWPTKKLVQSPEIFEFTKSDFFFYADDGTKLHAWKVLTDKEKQGTVFFLHGNAQNLSYHVANIYWLSEIGWEVVIMDYRGYGLSEGEPDFASIQIDARAGYQQLLSQQENNLPNIVWGQSLGASVAVNLVAELSPTEQPQGLIIDSAFSSHRRIMQETLGKSWLTWLFQYPLSWFITTDYSPLTAVSQIMDVPILIAHSNNDPLISSSHAEALFEQTKAPKQLWISDTRGHITIWDDPLWRNKLICQLKQWPNLQSHNQACVTDN